MEEIVKTYTINNQFDLIPMSRKEFYVDQIKEYKDTGKPSKLVEVVNILIFNSEGEVIIQKRSSNKSQNPNLLDKSIGGHVRDGDSAQYTAMVETIQELQTPSMVLRNKEDFIKTINLLRDYLDTTAILQYVDTKIRNSKRIIDGEEIEIGNKTNIYFGVYDGRIRPVDKEAKGVLFYSIKELEEEVENYPETFTNDLVFFIKEYKKEISNFIDEIKNKKTL